MIQLEQYVLLWNATLPVDVPGFKLAIAFLTCKKFHKKGCSLNDEINIMFCDAKKMLIFLFHKW